MSSSEISQVQPTSVSVRRSLVGLALPVILVVAFAIRAAAVWTQTYVLYVDETFQYFEQGHRLAFGSGLVPWEFQDGIRSWLLPGLIAGVMRLTTLITADPLVYVRLVRLLCATLSLSIVLTGFRAGDRLGGLTGAIITGGFCAVWFDLIYFSPAVLTEVLAAHCAILAICLIDRTSPRRWSEAAIGSTVGLHGRAQSGRPRGLASDVPDEAGRDGTAARYRSNVAPEVLLIGALFGLAFCLRYQYAPALLAAMLWRYRLSWPDWRGLLAGGLTVVLLLGGVLDALTWGSPFQSIWLNFLRNSVQGVSAGMGVEPSWFYLSYLDVAFRPLPLLGALAVIGGFRMPVLGLLAAVTLLEHSLIPHKEVRFVYLALAAAPILIGLGFTTVVEYLSVRLKRQLAPSAAAAFLLASTCLSWWTGAISLGPRWQFERANTLAFLAAHEEPAMCGLAVRDVWFWETGGYTYLHRDVPLWFADDDPGRTLPGTDRPLGLIVMLDGKPVPRLPAGDFAAARGRFSHMIAKRGNAEPGFEPVACFDDAARRGEPEVCLFRRAGGCS